MNLFDKLVAEALTNQPQLSPLSNVVEKELLHHDILRIMSHHQLLKDLTFIGGTCLRTCYGALRLSEDLDFTGGSHFTRESLSAMSKILIDNLVEKYGLQIKVDEPIKDKKNVDTWKIKVETRPQQKHIPAQRINIDICSVTSYEKQPMTLLNPYGVEMGTSGLIISAQSREEIYTDKLLAFALRPNRIKYRDLWDILWLHQQGLKPRFILIPNKLKDRNITQNNFFELFTQRQQSLKDDNTLSTEFSAEMQRFLPSNEMKLKLEQEGLWEFIIFLLEEHAKALRHNAAN